MSIRTEQIAAVIQRAVQNVLSRGLNDPRVRGLVSVTRVDVTDDLAHATVYISVLPAEHAELTMHGLRSATKHVRHEVAGALRSRKTPRLEFRLDNSLKKQAEVHRAIAEARAGQDDDGSSDLAPDAKDRDS